MTSLTMADAVKSSGWLRRKLEAAVVYHYTYFFFFGAASGLTVLVLLLFTPVYYLPLLYLVWYIYDWKSPSHGGYKSGLLRFNKMWPLYRDYFPMKLVKTAELSPEKNYILGYQPHGIICAGAFGNFATDGTGFTQIFPGIRPSLLTINFQFYFPIMREYFMHHGATTCTVENMSWMLNHGKGYALVLVVGGAYESLECRPGSLTLNLLRRKGFIRVALEHGASLVPVYSFGENEIYNQHPNPIGSWLRSVQTWLIKYLGFTTPIFYGRWLCPLFPYRHPINTVVGAPIDVEKDENPSQEKVDVLHQRYIDALVQLYETHKKNYGYTDQQKLTIV